MKASSLIVFDILNDPSLFPFSQCQLSDYTRIFIWSPNLELYCPSWLAKSPGELALLDGGVWCKFVDI